MENESCSPSGVRLLVVAVAMARTPGDIHSTPVPKVNGLRLTSSTISQAPSVVVGGCTVAATCMPGCCASTLT
ncbi:hypothetical protein D3C87_1339460 [compost metagenome]